MIALLVACYVVGAVAVGLAAHRYDGVGDQWLDYFGVGVLMIVWPLLLAFVPAMLLWVLGWLVGRLADRIEADR